MSSNNKKNKTNNNIKKDEIISSVVEMKPKDNRIVYCLCLVIIILISLLIYFIFINTSKTKCECDPIEKEVEVLPKHQLINFQGFKFQMPLDWSFVGKENSYEISNTDENLFIVLDSLDEDYEVFKTDTYQKLFLEKIQTSSNTKIEHTNKYLENMKRLRQKSVAFYLMFE